MDEQTLRNIIQLILDAIAEVRRPKRALVLFTGALLGFEDSLDPLWELRQDGLEMGLVQTPTAEHLLDQSKISALGLAQPGPHLTETYDILVIPTCTVNTVAKVACGIADSLATNLVSEFLSLGKQVVAATTAADPDCEAKRARFPLMPPAQASLMRDNLKRMRELGVRCCGVADLATCVRQALGITTPVPPVTGALPGALPPVPPVPPDCPAPLPGAPVKFEPVPVALTPQPAPDSIPEARPACPDHLIAAHHVQGLPAGAILTVHRDAIVTQLAADLARTRSIRIERA